MRPHLPAPRSLLELCCPPDVVERSSGTGMGSSPSSGASLTGGLSFPGDTEQDLSLRFRHTVIPLGSSPCLG